MGVAWRGEGCEAAGFQMGSLAEFFEVSYYGAKGSRVGLLDIVKPLVQRISGTSNN